MIYLHNTRDKMSITNKIMLLIAALTVNQFCQASTLDILHVSDPGAPTTFKQRLLAENPPAVLMISSPAKSDDTFLGCRHHRITTFDALITSGGLRFERGVYTTVLKDPRTHTWYRVFYENGQGTHKLPTRDDLHGSYAPLNDQIGRFLKKFDLWFYEIHGYEYRLVMESTIANDLKGHVVGDNMYNDESSANRCIQKLSFLLSAVVEDIPLSQNEKTGAMECRFWLR